jgi:leader peptidase (prepilin peptidase) / N-methyltransferase
MATASAKAGLSLGGIGFSLPDDASRATYTAAGLDLRVQGLNLLTGIFTALLGLAFGSFLNVCIWRLPRHESVAAGRSRCPECGAAIRAQDNVPLLSFLLLRGRCRDCGARISWRYPAIELATAALWVLCWLEFGLSLEAAGMAVFCFLALGLAAMDAETMLLPDAFTLPGIALGVIYSGAMCDGGWLGRLRCAGLSLGWAACAAVLILAIRGIYWLVRRREGMGMGDAKLFAMIAAWLGPANAVLALFLAVVGAAIYGVLWVGLRGGQRGATARIPLGSFLCAAAIYAVFEGPWAVDWYLGFFR